MNTFQVEIVSAEEEICEVTATKLFVQGDLGGLEILYNHAPLLTTLQPGPVWVITPEGKEQGFVVIGGFLEVQNKRSIILADSAIRAGDIDELAAQKAKEKLMNKIARGAKVDYAKAQSELAYAIAQLSMIKKLRRKIR